jgi:hypothetical protein
MAMWKSISMGVIVLTLVSWIGKSWAGDGVPLRTPEAGENSVGGMLACGALVCVDVYKVRCGGKTRYLSGFVTDNDGVEDNLTLTLTALTPGPIKGDTVQTFIEFGVGPFASSPSANLVRHNTGTGGLTTGAMQAYAAVSNIDNIFVSYIVNLQCLDEFGLATPTFITAEQNQ